MSRPILVFSLLLASGCGRASAQQSPLRRVSEAAALRSDASVTVAGLTVPRGFTLRRSPPPGLYSAHIERLESGHPTMEVHYSRNADAEARLELRADGTLSFAVEGHQGDSSSRSEFAGGRLADGAAANVTDRHTTSLRARMEGCWRREGDALWMRLGWPYGFRCDGDGGSSWRLGCLALEGGPAGLSGTTLLVCQPRRDEGMYAGFESLTAQLEARDAVAAPPGRELEHARQWLVLGPGAGLAVRFEVRTWSVHDPPRFAVTARMTLPELADAH